MNGRLLGLLLLTAAACDNRACLAQLDVFESYRPELVAECCACLARAGTRAPGAACAEAVLNEDDVVAPPPDAGPSIPQDAPFAGDDLDDVVDGPDGGLPGEIPCLCADTEAQCVEALTNGVRIVVTGACVAQGGRVLEHVPCGRACNGVLAFEPITAPSTDG